MASESSPPELDPDFSLYYPKWFIRWCADAMRAWHIPPMLWLTVPESFILDLIRWINQDDAVREAAKSGAYFGEVSDEDFEGMFDGHATMRSEF